MKVLCLNNHYRDTLAHADISYIMDIDANFYNKSLLSKLRSLLKYGRNYDRIVFYRDHKLLVIYSIIIKYLNRTEQNRTEQNRTEQNRTSSCMNSICPKSH